MGRLACYCSRLPSSDRWTGESRPVGAVDGVRTLWTLVLELTGAVARGMLLAIFRRCRHNGLVSKPRWVLSGWVLVVACGASHEPIGDASETGGGAGQAQGRCPAGTGAWASQSANLLTGRAQYERCEALCQAARSASCAGHDYDQCVNYCNALQNNSVNGRCTEAIGATIACFETVEGPCNTPQRSVAGSCEAEGDDMRCCFERYCADPANAGACP
jgi:hypothetical protein